MDGSALVGAILLLGAVGLLGRRLLQARRVKSIPHDAEVKVITLLERLRDTTLVLTLCAMALFLFINSGMSQIPSYAAEYPVLTNVGEFAVWMTFVTIPATMALQVIKEVKYRKYVADIKEEAAARYFSE